MYDLIIVGAGPAGLAAGVYTARKKLNALIVSRDIGGQANRTTGVENYLGYQLVAGAELMEKFHSQVAQYPIEQKIGEVVTRVDKADNVFNVRTESGAGYQSRAVIYAAGKSPRMLDVPGETEFANRGVTYCSICDGPIFAGQKVAVIGGGNSALESAIDMTKIAEYVYLVSMTRLTADEILVDRLKAARNVTIFTGFQVERIEGDRFVTSLTIKEIVSGKQQKIELGGVFIEIGLQPNTGPVKHLLRLNEVGEIPINCACETEVPALYAAGDVTISPEKQILIAAGEGAKAALQAHRYIRRLP